MPCISPPELPEGALLRFLDGEADERVEQHMRTCEHCLERARSLARLQGRLRASLYRFDCPSSSDLGEYHLGMLPSAESKAIRAHIQLCPHCAQELAVLESYLEALRPDLEIRAGERVRVWIARLMSGSQAAKGPGPQFAPALAGVRGAAAGPLIYMAEGVQIAMEVVEDVEQPGRGQLLGLVTGVETKGWTVQLWRLDERVAETPIDDAGNFTIQDLISGEYSLIMGDSEREIHIPELKMEW